MNKRRRTSFLAILCACAMIFCTVAPADIIYAQESQNQENIEQTASEAEIHSDGSVCTEGCVLDDGFTVFDAWKENAPAALLSEECAPSEVQKVHEIVVFIAFADEGEQIYETRGG